MTEDAFTCQEEAELASWTHIVMMANDVPKEVRQEFKDRFLKFRSVLLAENTRLREALKPFAIEFDGKWADADELSVFKGINDGRGALYVTQVGDHRRAREALASAVERRS